MSDLDELIGSMVAEIGALRARIEELEKTEIDDVSTVQFADNGTIDAFGRARFSQPETIFDSKRLSAGTIGIFWDDAEISGSGTTTAYSVNEAATTIGVSNLTAGARELQTYRSFNYQPGKSQLIFMTFSEIATAAGVKKWVGYKNGDNGLYLQHNSGAPQFVVLSNVTGTPTETVVSQSAWNVDTMDGTGASGITADFSKTQILIIDFEWLGVGRVRFGFVVDGKIYYAHEVNNANVLATVYMSSPNLPLQYGIENDGTGAADELVCICASVISEGGSQRLGLTRHASTDGTHVDASTADTIYAIVGIRLKSDHLYLSSQIERVTAISETNDDFEWLLIFNPTIAGTFTYSDLANSCMQKATGATANTVTLGANSIVVDGGFAKSASSIAASVTNALELGADITGNRDEYVLCVRPLSPNARIQGAITWRELL